MLALVSSGAEVASAASGETVVVVTNQTPFYAESGGQVGDTGRLTWDDGSAEVTDTRKVEGVVQHVCSHHRGDADPRGLASRWRLITRAAARSAPTTRQRICCMKLCAAHLETMLRSAAL